MDQRCTQRSLDCRSVQAPGTPSFELLLRACNAERLRPYAYEAGRRDLHRVALLRLSKNHARATARRMRCQPKTDPKSYERAWSSREPTRSQYLKSPSGAHQVSVSLAQHRDHQALASVEYRHHVHPVAQRLCLSRCRNGLVQSVGSLSSPFEQLGDSFLLRGVRRSHQRPWSTRDFQYRPGSTVHLPGVCRCNTQQGHFLQHGRSRSGTRQYFCRAPMEIGKI